MMIGVRNPRGSNTSPVDVCLWADELRLTDFDRTAGWAVNSVLNAKLADLGNITAALKHTTFGFGGVQSKISERRGAPRRSMTFQQPSISISSFQKTQG